MPMGWHVSKAVNRLSACTVWHSQTAWFGRVPVLRARKLLYQWCSAQVSASRQAGQHETLNIQGESSGYQLQKPSGAEESLSCWQKELQGGGSFTWFYIIVLLILSGISYNVF